MSLTTTTTVLVTGSKAGIGKGLLETYAARPNHTVISAIRDDPDSAIAKAMTSIEVGAGSKIIVAKYDASSPTAATEMVEYLKRTRQITTLDVVIANAGILKHSGPGVSMKAAEALEHFTVNTLAPILLYQATQSLLNASQQTPKFFIISSTIGSNTLMDSYPLPLFAYGMSKAAVNYAAGKLHREEEKIVIVPVQPGWVQTAMGEKAAEIVGMSSSDVPVTLEQSVGGLVTLFDAATKLEHSGKFWDYEGQSVPW